MRMARLLKAAMLRVAGRSRKSVASALRDCTHALKSIKVSMRDLHVESLVLAALDAIRAMRENADGSSSQGP